MKGNTPVDQFPTTKDKTDEAKPDAAMSRRTVLRGALAAGCGLLVPAALLGCDTRKKEEAGSQGTTPMADPGASGLPPAPGAAPGAESAAPAAPAAPSANTAKAAQASVQYQTQPKGDQQCANCRYFVAASNTCQLVEGDISPKGWCILWAKGDISRREQRRDISRASQLA